MIAVEEKYNCKIVISHPYKVDENQKYIEDANNYYSTVIPPYGSPTNGRVFDTFDAALADGIGRAQNSL